jgi:Protein of unknown function (DUF2786)
VTDPLLARVRKLLAKAEDPACTPAEAEAFTAKATELIAKYGVDRALLAAADPALDPVGDQVVPLDPPYALDKAGLLASVAVPLRCRVVRKTRSGVQVHLFGHAADLERVELLFTSLLVQAAHGLSAVPVPAQEHPAAFRRSWLAGFAHAIGGRLREAEQAASDAAPGAALVLVRRSDLVEHKMAQAYPKLRTASRRRLAGGGLEQGFAAGQAASLGSASPLTS